MPVKVYTTEQKRGLIQQALDLRYEGKLNWDDVAQQISVSRSTLSEWRKEPLWKELDAERRRLLREEARSDGATVLTEMLDVLYELAKGARSEYVRFTAASKLLDINNVGAEIEEAAVDQAKELNEFLGRLSRRSQSQVSELATVRVLPGGLLPPEVQERNEEYRDRKRLEAASLEAEFREV